MENPYSSTPESIPPEFHSPPGIASPGVIDALAGTRFWVRLCSVLGFIGSGFMVIAGLLILLGGAASTASLPEGNGSMVPIVIGLGVFYLLFSGLLIYPSIKLWTYGSHIVRLLVSRSETDLVAALHAQRVFWRFVGWMIVSLVVLYFVGILVIGGFITYSAIKGVPTP
ncbi:hypothetical protein HNR46_003339 [Haloferula luteola]|uniref:DUF5362 domain-containing protein n=2 Tax=Haloferula luteola TaxID=595692 RepID=A0A840V7R3_9BACT|nr:hypothetical protein [Haloferula luteola]